MIEEKDIKKLAELARIELTDTEVQSFKGEFEQILEYVSHLDAPNTVSADTAVNEYRTILREDGTPHAGGAYTKDLISAAPRAEDNFISVGKVIKGAQ